MTQPKTASKFTPGPWILEPNGAAFNLVRESSGQPHHMILLGMKYNQEGELAANARLIAQAPEMYELLSHIENMGQSGMSLRWIEDDARRIKAEIDGVE